MQGRPSAQQKIAQSLAIGLFAGSLIWISLLCRASAVVQSAPSDMRYAVRFGPFLLNTVSKYIHHTGYTASISLGNGLLWYAAAWLAAGLVLGVLRVVRSR